MQNNNKNPYEFEGSGQQPEKTQYGYPSTDDEDSRLNPILIPGDTKVIHTNIEESNTNKIIDMYGRESTTPKSSASSLHYTDINLVLLVLSSLFYVFNLISAIS